MIKDAIFGLAVGDALGVPVEFKSRESIRLNPVREMVGYGTHHQPAGTWSDDSSLAFCLAEVLTKEFNLHRIAVNFSGWLNQNYWTPHGTVFDVGISTRQAIRRFDEGTPPELAGGFEETDNGNGSLMRILPLIFYSQSKSIQQRFELTRAVSSITHGHIRSIIACFYYLEFAKMVVEGKDKFQIYKSLQADISDFLRKQSINPVEIQLFHRLLEEDISELTEQKIFSTGYVIHTLEASISCLLTSDSYSEAVLKAVNLGGDTDTIGAVTGGLAGLLFGFESIPKGWIEQIARKDDIAGLVDRLTRRFSGE